MSPRSSTKKVSRLWNHITQNPFWATVLGGLIVALVAAAIVAHAGNGIFGSPAPASTATAPAPAKTATSARPASPTMKLDIDFRQESTAFFDIALRDNIGIPKASERWPQLHARGGVDVRRSKFYVTITNPTEAPITITDIEAVVEYVKPAANAWIGSAFSQGAEVIEHFGIFLEDPQVGAHIPLRVPEHGISFPLPTNPSYFANHVISLHGGEIYHGIVTVETSRPLVLGYRFIVSAETASHHFVERTGIFQITGQSTAPHEVLYLGPCWVVSQPDKFPTCT